MKNYFAEQLLTEPYKHLPRVKNLRSAKLPRFKHFQRRNKK
jgi:hypothetical protein